MLTKKMLNKNSIGIIGSNGFIGQILKRYYPQAKGYDIKGVCNPWDEVRKCEMFFVCVNFQDNCAGDESKSALNNYFATMEKGSVVIIKSTFIPSTLDFFQEKYPYLRFVFNPEFLTEMTAWEDFTKPQFQILGCPHQSLHLVHEIFSLLPEAPIKKVISPVDAEFLKHAFNSYFALKVTWFNQLYDACVQGGADYETLREIMVQNPWIGNSHSTIFHKGYRGYGGKCLSKDPKALAKITKFPLINHIEEYNETLKKIQELDGRSK